MPTTKSITTKPITTTQHLPPLTSFLVNPGNFPRVSVQVALALLIGLGLGLFMGVPLYAQETSGESSLLERLHAARTQEVASAQVASTQGTPPLPFAQPQLGPKIQVAAPGALRAATVSSATGLAGVSGYGLGQSDIGTGLEILKNPDDMEARSTEIDVSLTSTPEGFTFPDVGPGERWIRVDLGRQQVIAYEGMTPVRAFIVSTGLASYQTVTGEFRIRTKVSNQVMSGVGYSLPNVKWVMYFYSEYALHGSYWHSNFGNPMSHGCVNMTNADAKWLFDWAGPVWDGSTVWYNSTPENPGTRVVVHS